MAIFDERTEKMDHRQMFRMQIEYLTVNELAILIDAEQVDALEELENPAHGCCLGLFSDLACKVPYSGMFTSLPVIQLYESTISWRTISSSSWVCGV